MQCNFPEEVASFIGETARCAMGFRELLLVLCSYRPGTQHSGDPKGGIVYHLYMFVHCMVYSTSSSRPGAEVSGGRKPISQMKEFAYRMRAGPPTSAMLKPNFWCAPVFSRSVYRKVPCSTLQYGVVLRNAL